MSLFLRSVVESYRPRFERARLTRPIGTYSGTHKGEWLGIPATGKKYDFNAVDIFRVEDGKLAEHWDVLDVYTLFKQLGTIE